MIAEHHSLLLSKLLSHCTLVTFDCKWVTSILKHRLNNHRSGVLSALFGSLICFNFGVWILMINLTSRWNRCTAETSVNREQGGGQFPASGPCGNPLHIRFDWLQVVWVSDQVKRWPLQLISGSVEQNNGRVLCVHSPEACVGDSSLALIRLEPTRCPKGWRCSPLATLGQVLSTRKTGAH